jgi:hypothetical protein
VRHNEAATTFGEKPLEVVRQKAGFTSDSLSEIVMLGEQSGRYFPTWPFAIHGDTMPGNVAETLQTPYQPTIITGDSLK